MNPLERAIGAMQAMSGNTAVMAGNTSAMNQHTSIMAGSTQGMAQHTGVMADSTQTMAQMTDRMAKATEDMADATRRMADSTDKMEKHMGAMSKGIAPLVNAEENVENKSLRLRKDVEKLRQQVSHIPGVWNRIKTEIRDELER